MKHRVQKIVVNGLSNIRGGSSHYLHHIVQGLSQNDQLNTHVICHQDQRGIFEALPNVTVHAVQPVSARSIVNRIHFELIFMPRLLRRHQFDLLLNAYEVLPILGCFFSKKNVVAYHSTLQQSDTWCKTQLVRCVANRVLRAFSLRKANFVIFPSEMARREICFGNAYLLKKSAVIHHGIRDYQEMQDASILRDEHGVITVGDFYEHKQIDRVLDVFSEMHTQDTRLKFTIVGRNVDDAYFQKMLARIKNSALRDHVTVVSNISPQELCSAYQAHSLYFGLSVWESFGLTPGEAMANGCKVLIGYESALAEIYNNLVGFVFPELQSAHEMAVCAVNVMTADPMQKEAQSFIQRYTWGAASEKYQSLILNLTRDSSEKFI